MVEFLAIEKADPKALAWIAVELRQMEAVRSRASAQMPPRSRISNEEVLVSPRPVRASFQAFDEREAVTAARLAGKERFGDAGLRGAEPANVARFLAAMGEPTEVPQPLAGSRSAVLEKPRAPPPGSR